MYIYIILYLSNSTSDNRWYIDILWAVNHICYITQLTGCSYLVLQSRNVFAYLVLGVFPTSFYKLNMMFLTNRGTPEYYFPYTQIRAVAHILTIDNKHILDLPIPSITDDHQ